MVLQHVHTHAHAHTHTHIHTHTHTHTHTPPPPTSLFPAALQPVTGLHKAAYTGDRNTIMRIGRNEGPQAPLNLLDDNGCTPLMYAVIGDSKDAIEVLMNFSAKKEVVSEQILPSSSSDPLQPCTQTCSASTQLCCY